MADDDNQIAPEAPDFTARDSSTEPSAQWSGGDPNVSQQNYEDTFNPDTSETDALNDTVEDSDGEAGGKKRRFQSPWQKEEEASNNERNALYNKAYGILDAANESDNEFVFTGKTKGVKGRVQARGQGWVQNRFTKWLGGGFIALGIAGLVAGWGLVGNFKLEHLFQNIDQKSYAYFNSAFDRRSSKWFQAYLSIRMAEYLGDATAGNQPLYFRANRVDTNSPLSDWYRTLRTSNFENDLAKKGIRFTSSYDDLSGKVRFHQLAINVPDKNGEISRTIDISDMRNKDLRAGNLDNLINEYNNLIDPQLSQTFETDREARRAIKKVVDEEVNSLRWFKRRALRKDIQNMTGVRSWRFFETTRDKITTKKQSVKTKLVKMVVPEDTKAGKFIQCLLGVGKCNSSSDPGNPENQAGDQELTGNAADDGETNNEIDNNGDTITDGETGEPVRGAPDGSDAGEIEAAVREGTEEITEEITEEAGEDVAAAGLRGAIIRKIVSKFNGIVGAVSLADMATKIHNNITSGKVVSAVVAAKSAQVIANYATYHSIADQTKQGDLVRSSAKPKETAGLFEDPVYAEPEDEATQDEFNAVMEGLNGMERSEMYTAFFPSLQSGSAFSGSAHAVGANTTDGPPSRDEYCSDSHTPKKTDFHYLCADTKVGGKSNAQEFTDAYNNSVGRVIGPFVTAYKGVRNSPGIKQLLDLGVGATEQIGAAIEPLFRGTLGALGLEDNMNDALGWIMAKVMDFAGGGPMSDGDEIAGRQLNLIAQGGVASDIASTRQNGGSRATASSSNYLQRLVNEDKADKLASMSMKDRYLSLNDTDSIAHRSLFAINSSQTVSEVARTAFNPFKIAVGAASSSVGMAMQPSAYAAEFDYNKPAEVSGQDRFDIPAKCVDDDPINSMSDPTSRTNAEQVLGESLGLDWETVSDQAKFYAKVYDTEKIKNLTNEGGDVDAVVNQIYNCALFDSAILSSQAKPYEPITDADDILGTGGSNGDGTGTSGGTCTVGEDRGEKDGYEQGAKKPVRICEVHGVLVNSEIAKKFDDMFNAAKTAGINLRGSGFREMSEQERLYRCYQRTDTGADHCTSRNQAARPGFSNHQMGRAIDLNYSELSVSLGTCRASPDSYPTYKWLAANAATYGLQAKVNSECWHWSVSGN